MKRIRTVVILALSASGIWGAGAQHAPNTTTRSVPAARTGSVLVCAHRMKFAAHLAHMTIAALIMAAPLAGAEAGETAHEAKMVRVACNQVAARAVQAHRMRVKDTVTKDELLWNVQIDTAGFSPMLRRLVTDSVVVGFDADSERTARAAAIALCTGQLAS